MSPPQQASPDLAQAYADYMEAVWHIIHNASSEEEAQQALAELEQKAGSHWGEEEEYIEDKEPICYKWLPAPPGPRGGQSWVNDETGTVVRGRQPPSAGMEPGAGGAGGAADSEAAAAEALKQGQGGVVAHVATMGRDITPEMIQKLIEQLKQVPPDQAAEIRQEADHLPHPPPRVADQVMRQAMERKLAKHKWLAKAQQIGLDPKQMLGMASELRLKMNGEVEKIRRLIRAARGSHVDTRLLATQMRPEYAIILGDDDETAHKRLQAFLQHGEPPALGFDDACQHIFDHLSKQSGKQPPEQVDYERDVHERLERATERITEPSEAQKAYGNWTKGHIQIQNLPITIEYARGMTRCGTSQDGTEWEQVMGCHYGYFKGTRGRDKDHLDCFLGPDPDSEIVFVVDQYKNDGHFDELKCILPGQDFNGSVLAASKAFYTGQAVNLRCASGRSLSITPNHPVLTMRGLAPASSVKKGDYLVAHIGEDEFCAASYDKKYAPTIVEKVFSSLVQLNPLRMSRKLVSPLDFHGDAELFKGKVEIVNLNSQLCCSTQTKRRHSLNESQFIGSLVGESLLSRDSSANKGFSTKHLPRIAPLGNLSNTSIASRSLIRRPSRYGQAYSFGKPTDSHLAQLKIAADNANINPKAMRNALGRLAANVATDKIVNIEVVHYSGPVFDFQSVSGLIIINQLIISNCMVGFTNQKQARSAYLEHYPSGWNGLGAITAMTMNQFQYWLQHGSTTEPLGKK